MRPHTLATAIYPLQCLKLIFHISNVSSVLQLGLHGFDHGWVCDIWWPCEMDVVSIVLSSHMFLSPLSLSFYLTAALKDVTWTRARHCFTPQVLCSMAETPSSLRTASSTGTESLWKHFYLVPQLLYTITKKGNLLRHLPYLFIIFLLCLCISDFYFNVKALIKAALSQTKLFWLNFLHIVFVHYSADPRWTTHPTTSWMLKTIIRVSYSDAVVDT